MLKLRAAPAAKDALDAIDVLRRLNATGARGVPADAPIAFVKKRWEKLILSDEGIDRRYYELCAMAELKNSLRSGDIWVQGSRQFKDFDEYLVPMQTFVALQCAGSLPIAVEPDCDRYLSARLQKLQAQLDTVNRLAASNELPAAIITTS